MEFFTTAFWIALAEIIGVNLILSGDNAVVIALAARTLPAAQQKRAIFWGSAAAVALRVFLTIVAVEVLRLPYLKLVGGALLLWIGVKLLFPEADNEAGSRGGAKGNVMAAIRTIVLADLIMSLDNVIAVAAAAKGSLVLLILGLAISIPLVIFGSTLLLRLMQRFPIMVALGAGLLGWVAGEMAVADPLIRGEFENHGYWLSTIGPIAGAVLVLALGKWLGSQQRRTRHSAIDSAHAEAEVETNN